MSFIYTFTHSSFGNWWIKTSISHVLTLPTVVLSNTIGERGTSADPAGVQGCAKDSFWRNARQCFSYWNCFHPFSVSHQARFLPRPNVDTPIPASAPLSGVFDWKRHGDRHTCSHLFWRKMADAMVSMHFGENRGFRAKNVTSTIVRIAFIGTHMEFSIHCATTSAFRSKLESQGSQ